MTELTSIGRLEQLFEVLVELPPEERTSTAEQHCQGDPALAAQGLSLAAAHDRLVAANRRSAAVEAVSPLPRFGPYQAIRLLGSGGMGSVYQAERTDGQVRQMVAVKVLGRHLATEEFKRRFLDERQILAALNHPNIARFLDANVTPEGEPYLVLEHIEGRPLDQFVAQLSIRERLELLRKICDAVDFAHRNLVVHRDLKPGNILVGEDGEPKLLDFGAARLLSAAAHTVTLPLLTPRYCSPEQLRGNPVTTAADVYSLGVVAFEILSGKPAFRGENSQVLALRRALEDVPLGAAGDLSGELATIVAKSTETDTRRRYQSVRDFDSDIARYLEGRPVLARPQTWRYRATKFVRRNRWAASAVAVVLLTLAGAGIFSWRQATIARKEARRARAVSDFMTRMLASANPYAEGRRDMRVLEVLDQASRQAYQQFAGEPAIEAEIRTTLGDSYYTLDEPAKSTAEFRRSLELALVTGDVALRAMSRISLAKLLSSESQPQEAEAMLQGAMADIEGLKGSDATVEYSLLNRLGGYLSFNRAPGPDAERILLRAVQIARTTPGIAEIELASVMGQLGYLYVQWQRPDDAERWLSESLGLYRRMEKMPISAVGVLSTAAAHAVSKGDQVRVIALRKEALDINMRELGPTNSGTIISLGQWARSTSNAGKLDEALQALDQGIAALYKAHPKLVFSSWNPVVTYAELLGKANRKQEAEHYAREALNCLPAHLRETAFGAQSLFALGRALRVQGKRDEAIDTLERSLALYIKLHGEKPRTTGIVRKELEEARGIRPASRQP